MIRSDCYNSQEATMTQKKNLKKLSEDGYTTYILGGESLYDLYGNAESIFGLCSRCR